MTRQKIFDGHNDVLSKLRMAPGGAAAGFFEGHAGDVDLVKCREGGFAGGFFAIWAGGDPADAPDPMAKRREFPPIDVEGARLATLEMAATLVKMAASHPEDFQLCTSVAMIEAAEARGAIAALMHIEGCEGIGADLDELYLYHRAGLRSLGPVWSRDNVFGHGVPFDFPGSPDTGPGLTDAGKRLVKACDALGIVTDLSHLNEAGFWDVAAISQKPLVATHSGAHAITPATRNLTDRQLDAIAGSGGLVGLNFGVQFIRQDGIKISATPVADYLRHLDHLLEKLGVGGVALGSDFDGAMMPDFMGNAAGLPVLVQAMRDHGYDAALIRRICWDNWIDLLRRVIG